MIACAWWIYGGPWLWAMNVACSLRAMPSGTCSSAGPPSCLLIISLVAHKSCWLFLFFSFLTSFCPKLPFCIRPIPQRASPASSTQGRWFQKYPPQLQASLASAAGDFCLARQQWPNKPNVTKWQTQKSPKESNLRSFHSVDSLLTSQILWNPQTKTTLKFARIPSIF